MPDIIQVHNASRAFGPKAGIFDCSLSVAPSEVHALIGLNGAGKTTLMRAMLGMLHLTSGSVHIGGVPLNNMAQKAWKDVGHLIERPFAYPELDVRTNLKLAAQLNMVEPVCVPKTVDAAMIEFGLSTYAEVAARKLSLGNKQRLGLAAALQHHPKLIILDEPTSGLDPAGVIMLREVLLHRLDDGVGVLVSSHHLDEVARIANRISVINYGRYIGSLEPDAPDLERAFFDLVLADDEQRF